MSLSQEIVRRPEKMVLRQTADRLIATLDTSGAAMARSVISLTSEADVSLPALLACLNSTYLTDLYRLLAGEEGRVLPQVKVSRLLALPVPAVCRLPISSEAKWRAIQDADRGWLEEDRVREDPLRAWALLDRIATLHLKGEGRDQGLDARIDLLVAALYAEN